MIKHFERWNWETDTGERPIPSTGLPKEHAVAHYDFLGRVFRVTVRACDVIGQTEPDTFRYDYFFDEAGMLVEKRSLDDKMNVSLIVRIAYDATGRRVSESAWHTKDDASAVVKKQL